MKHICSKTLSAVFAFVVLCSNTYAQGTVDLLNYPSCTVKYYDWDYGTTDGYNFGWVFSNRTNPDGTRHKIVNAQGSDPNVPISNCPPGETSAIRLGTANYATTYGQDYEGNIYVANTEMAKGGGVVFTYKVTQENALLFIKYATLLTDPLEDHYNALINIMGLTTDEGLTIGDAAMFEYATDWQYQQPYVHMYMGVDGVQQDCTERYQCLYDEAGNAVQLSNTWKSASFDIEDQYVYYHYDGYYKPWSTMAIDLTPFIGHTVSFGAEYRDCAQAGWFYFLEDVNYQYPQIYTCDDHHLARLYLHASCAPAGDGVTVPSPLEITNESCEARQVSLQAPEGFTSYKWYSGNSSKVLSTTQTCTYNFAADEQNAVIYCDVTSQMTTGCPTETTTLRRQLTACDEPEPEPEPEIEIVSRSCKPDQAVCMAPEGFAYYRWYSSKNPTLVLSTNNTCTYNFSAEGEAVDLYCEMTQLNGQSSYKASIYLYNDCVNGNTSTIQTPASVCADAASLHIGLNYTDGYPVSYDISFDEAAQNQGFQNVTGVAIINRTAIDIPMPKPETGGYIRPDRYNASLVIHQAYNKDTTVYFGFYVLYPTSVLRQKWDDVLAVRKTEYNGGYQFSSIRWYKNGEVISGMGVDNSYIYLYPGKFEAGDTYWAELTRIDDGKTFCTCPLTPVPANNNGQQQGQEQEQEQGQEQGQEEEQQSAKGRINVSAISDGGISMLHISSDLSGIYTVYDLTGAFVMQGMFGAAYGAEEFDLRPAARGTCLIVFRADDGTVETRKVLVY